MITISGPLQEIMYNEELQEKIQEIEKLYPASIHGTDMESRPRITTYYIGKVDEVYPRTTYGLFKINDFNYDECDVIDDNINDELDNMQEEYPQWQRTRYNLTTYIREQYDKCNKTRAEAEELLTLNGLNYQQVINVLPSPLTDEEMEKLKQLQPINCKCEISSYTKEELSQMISTIYNIPSDSSESIVKAMDLLFKEKRGVNK